MKFKNKTIQVLSLCLLVTVTFVVNAADKTNTKTRVIHSSEKVGDWGLSCQNRPEKRNLCSMSQKILSKDNNEILMHVSVSYADGIESPIINIRLPLGINLPKGVAIKVGESSVSYPFIYCDKNACYSVISVDESTLNLFSSHDKGTIFFNDLNNQVLSLPFSLTGFSAALAQIKI